MTWLCRRLKHRFDPPPVSREELVRVREESQERAAHTAAQEKEVRTVVARLRHQRTENHFGPMIWSALRGEPDV